MSDSGPRTTLPSWTSVATGTGSARAEVGRDGQRNLVDPRRPTRLDGHLSGEIMVADREGPQTEPVDLVAQLAAPPRTGRRGRCTVSDEERVFLCRVSTRTVVAPGPVTWPLTTTCSPRTATCSAVAPSRRSVTTRAPLRSGSGAKVASWGCSARLPAGTSVRRSPPRARPSTRHVATSPGPRPPGDGTLTSKRRSEPTLVPGVPPGPMTTTSVMSPAPGPDSRPDNRRPSTARSPTWMPAWSTRRTTGRPKRQSAIRRPPSGRPAAGTAPAEPDADQARDLAGDREAGHLDPEQEAPARRRPGSMPEPR